MYFGGDYNPEQWPREVWDEDVALMREAGVNLVTVGVFAWSRLEPAPGEYDFGWLDTALDLLHDNGVQVNLATPTASPPPWFPAEARNVTAAGTRLTHGSRDTYCASSPFYREKSREIATELAERYGDHPALAMWHVHNEYGTWCHCERTAEAFRAWLRQRHGTLPVLNEAWTTSFWSQHYSDWDQITPPRDTQYLPNPAQLLDFRRFQSDELLACFREQKRILAPTGVPVTTNLVFGAWVPVDQRRWADDLDLIAIDHYPAGNPPEETAFAADLARCWAGGRPWLLMEQAVLTYRDGRMLAKPPGEITRLTLSPVARGSTGALFFQWRASRGGAEMWHGGMVPHAGPDSAVFREVRDLGALLSRLPEGVPGPAEAAILWDTESWWALQSPGLPSPDLDYLAAVRQAHRVLYRHGVPADFAYPSSDLSAYRLVIAPSLYLLPDDDAANLRRYAEGGGRLVVSYLTGTADPHGRVRTGGYPGALRDLLGIRVEEFRPLEEPVKLSTGDTGTIWSEHVHLRGAEALARYPDGSPAITRHGTAYYVSTHLTDDAYARLLDLPAATSGLEQVRNGALRYAVNHGPVDREIAPGHDLVTGTRVGTLPPGGFAVLT